MAIDIAHTVYTVIKYGILIAIFVGFSILLIGSVLVHDTAYITKNPKFFLSETLFMAILTSIPVVYICYLRGATHSATVRDMSLIFIKMVLLHVGFQLSGVYTVLFDVKST